MKLIKYILVNDTNSEEPSAVLLGCRLPGIAHHHLVSGNCLEAASPQRDRLVKQLCNLRRRYPEAKILGLSELRAYCVLPNEAMNLLRRSLSSYD